MQALFGTLTSAVEHAAWLALPAAVLWGVLSVVLSPCHLACIPLVVAFINGQAVATVKRAAALSTILSLGVLVSIAAIGAATAIAGRMLGDLGPAANMAMGVVFIGTGLILMDVIPLNLPSGRIAAGKLTGGPAAFLLGLLFGVTLGPCTFAFMAPVLGVCLKVGARNWPYAVALLSSYGVGHCAVLAAAGASAEFVQRLLNISKKGAIGTRIKRVCAALVCLGGLYLIYTA
jgi:cytochrome c-type biogenesis protein